MRETPQTDVDTSLACKSRSSKNATYMGTIRREVRKEHHMTPQRPDVGDPTIIAQRLNPDWIAGFIDGEGCFHIGISKHPELRFGHQILPELTVVQHKRDIDLLYRIRSVMNCGVVRRNHGDRYCWRVRKLENLAKVVVPFFDKYKLNSKKRIEFHKFAKVVKMMVNREHLTEEGFNKICKIASTMNRANPAIDRIKIESIPK